MDETHWWIVNQDDVQILRDLFKRKREIAQDPIMKDRRRLWTRHASLDSQRPMILTLTRSILDTLVPASTLRCQEEWARDIERGLRQIIFRYEHIQDDFVVEPWIEYRWHVTIGDFGVKTGLIHGDSEGKLGSYRWDPPIEDLDKDFDKLHFRHLKVDRERTVALKNLLEEFFGDILPVRNRGGYWWTTGLTQTAIYLIGMEQHRHGFLDQKGYVLDLFHHNTEINIPFALSNRGYGFIWNNPA